MYRLIRPLLFTMDPEQAHAFVLNTLRFIPQFFFPRPVSVPVQTMGLEFKHPVGLAAGFDKNGDYIDALGKLGFSFIELGTVTPRPQTGNPLPRLFRIPEKQVIINRMGFNNLGVDHLIENIKKTSYAGIIGVNIGKNKDTPLSQALDDYLYCLERAFLYADYISVNVSSPNTPNLRQLQEDTYFRHLLSSLREEQLILCEKHQKYVPIVVKISPDESDESVKRMASIALQEGFDGIIATNTTCSREGVHGLPHADEQGGMSGRLLSLRATHCLRILKETVGDELSLIGVGGIDSKDRAKERCLAGASLIQVYSGLIYQGPCLVSTLVSGCAEIHKNMIAERL